MFGVGFFERADFLLLPGVRVAAVLLAGGRLVAGPVAAPPTDLPRSPVGVRVGVALRQLSRRPAPVWEVSPSAHRAAMSIGRVPTCLTTQTGIDAVAEFLEPVGMQQQMSISYQLGRTHYRAFVLGRSPDDFPDEDLLVARGLQPLLQLLDRQH